MEEGMRPLLLIDADPAGGLVHALGESAAKTLTEVRDKLVETARSAGDRERESLARSLDYMLMEALVERTGYSLLAMGRERKAGCYCPANTLLRDAIDSVSAAFRAAVIDAEAGLEQINRRVTRNVTHTIIITDGSARSVSTLVSITGMIDEGAIFAVHNMADNRAVAGIPEGMVFAGSIPADKELRQFDRSGRSLRELPAENAAVLAVKAIAARILSDGNIVDHEQSA
jgi:CO dehydrogenase maturation factor